MNFSICDELLDLWRTSQFVTNFSICDELLSICDELLSICDELLSICDELLDLWLTSLDLWSALKNTKKARKYPQNPVQNFAPHELRDSFLESPDL